MVDYSKVIIMRTASYRRKKEIYGNQSNLHHKENSDI